MATTVICIVQNRGHKPNKEEKKAILTFYLVIVPDTNLLRNKNMHLEYTAERIKGPSHLLSGDNDASTNAPR